MSKKKKLLKSTTANPLLINPFDKKGLLQVIVETPKGSRNKYAFNDDLRVFALKKVLPAGMGFPYDFGFVPSTLAEDGDAVDVLILMDEPAFAGCLLKCRVIGIIEGSQGTKKKLVRNDRIVAIERDNHSFADIKHLKDLGKQFLEELEDFFVNYHELSGAKYHVLGIKGPKGAILKVKKTIKAFHKG
jgi:inorganic pyrophosphatase